jgi:hypothetical protein
MDNQSPDISDLQEWSSELQQFVQDRQEREYRRLAEELKLGSDPANAYAYFSRSPLHQASDVDRYMRLLTVDPFRSLEAKAYAQMLGNPMDPELQVLALEDLLPVERLQEFRERAIETHNRCLSLKLPTLYEDPHHYGSMILSFDRIQKILNRQGHTSLQNVFLATIPSGHINATVVIEPYTDDRIIFFEHGLFQFLGDFARLIGGITIPLLPQQLTSDIALTRLPTRHSMPPTSTDFFLDLFGGYVAQGTPAKLSAIPEATHNMFTTVILDSLMQLFVMAHELSHVKLGHLDKKPAKELEYEADAFGLALVSKSALEYGGSWAVGFWACDLVLTAFNFLYRTLALLAFGPTKFYWISPTHPDPLSRRARLREIAAQVIPDVSLVGLRAAGELCRMTDALLQTLWENSTFSLYYNYQNRGVRPLSIWNDEIKAHISK